MNHLDNFGTNLTSGTSASDTTSPVNSVPSIAAPFWVAFDATNINNHYETKLITSKTATNILHSALSYDHTTAEEVRIVNPAAEFDALSTGWQTGPGTWTYSSADSPTFVLTTSVDLSSFIGVGARIKLTQTTEKFFIVTVISGTTITLYGGTDYTLTAAAITNPYFSIMKAPIGFPLDPLKWQLQATDQTERSQASPVQGTWYNLNAAHKLDIPIGAWDLMYWVGASASKAAGTVIGAETTLSTANNSESDADFSDDALITTGSASIALKTGYHRRKNVLLASKTSYYLNVRTNVASATDIRANQTNNGQTAKLIIRAVCAYL